MIRMTTKTVDVIADTVVATVTEHADLDAAYEAVRASIPAGWVLWDFSVSEDSDDECSALVVRG